MRDNTSSGLVDPMGGSGLVDPMGGSGLVDPMGGSGLVDPMGGSGLVDPMGGSGLVDPMGGSGLVDPMGGSGLVDPMGGSGLVDPMGQVWVSVLSLHAVPYLAQEVGIPHHHKQRTCSADGHVETLGVANEPEMMPLVHVHQLSR